MPFKSLSAQALCEHCWWECRTDWANVFNVHLPKQGNEGALFSCENPKIQQQSHYGLMVVIPDNMSCNGSAVRLWLLPLPRADMVSTLLSPTTVCHHVRNWESLHRGHWPQQVPMQWSQYLTQIPHLCKSNLWSSLRHHRADWNQHAQAWLGMLMKPFPAWAQRSWI